VLARPGTIALTLLRAASRLRTNLTPVTTPAHNATESAS